MSGDTRKLLQQMDLGFDPKNPFVPTATRSPFVWQQEEAIARSSPKPAKQKAKKRGAPVDDDTRSIIIQSACDVLGIANPEHINERNQGGFHFLGTMRIRESEGALRAAFTAYRTNVIATRQTPCFSFREYQKALSNVASLKKSWDNDVTALTDNQRNFLVLYDSLGMDEISPDLSGYVTYLAKTATDFHQIVSEPIKVYTPEEPRRQHSYVVGTTGSGKSELLKTLIHSYVRDPKSASVVVIEPSGKLVRQIAQWREFIGSKRLVYLKLDLTPGMVPTINPFKLFGVHPSDMSREALHHRQVVAQQLFGALEQIVGIRMGGTLTTNMRAILMPCILVLLEREGSNLLDLMRFMDEDRNGDLVQFGASRTHYPGASEFIGSKLNRSNFSGTRSSIHTKLQTLLDTNFFRELTCGDRAIDLEALVDNHKIILIDAGKDALGNDVSSAFGRLITAQIQAIAIRRGSRPFEKHVPIHLIVDECHNFLSPTVEEILTESRKFGLHLTMAQQNVGYKMSGEMKRIVTGNTNVKIAGMVQSDEYESTASLFPVPSADMAQLSKDPNKGVFFIKAGKGDTFRFHARSDLIDDNNSVTKPAWKVTIANQVRTYYHPANAYTEPEPVERPSRAKKRNLKLQ